ncbi:hemolysin XhlA family protein [Peribacillus simplex]|uniref:hemolysin XhlA family protein n=1 Tax=Peribacillus simplex TaxID=1478 RepID=UPI00298DBA5B|nr:hemolysin XhlA family protein [Peribacillus simplex]MDW7617768.1 hemolysin XhlA family protein [Peribacillus simplex]
MTEIQEFKKEIQQVKIDQKDIQRDIRNMESRITITEKDILTINKQLEKISSNTTWILRLIIGSLLTGALGMVLKGFM